MCYDILALLIKPSEVKNIRGEGASPEGEDGESPPPPHTTTPTPPPTDVFALVANPLFPPSVTRRPFYLYMFFFPYFFIYF